MRSKTKWIILSTGICAYAMIKEALKMEKRYEELETYEETVNGVIDKFNDGIDIDGVININFKK